jgi:hypothetical protein
MAVTKEYNLKISTKEAQANIDELNKSLEAQEDLIEDIEADLRKYEKQLKETSGKELSRRKALNDKIKETKDRLNEEKAGLKTINKERKRANAQLKEAEKNTADYSGVIGVLDRQTGGAISSIQNMTGSIGGATKGFKLMRAAIIATGIGALVIAITSVATAFTNSEAGQNKFNKLMTQIGVVVGNVTDILGNFGNVLINVFTGNLKGAKEALNDVTEGIKNFGEETKKEIKIAGELADARAKADIMERDLITERAEATRKFNELREKAADKENVSIEDRIEALREAGRIEDEITQKEIEAARIRFETKKAENALSESTKEDLDEEAQLQARLIQLEADRLKKQKTLTAEITTNLREAKAERKADQAEKDRQKKEDDAKELQAEKDLANLKKQIREAEATSQDEKRALELTKIEEHYQALIDKAIENDLVTDELEASMREAKLAKQAEYDEQDEAKQKEKDAKILADKQAMVDAETQLEEQKRATREKTFDNAVMLAGEESKVGKALLLVKQVLLAKKLILDAKEQIANAKKAVTNATINAAESGTEVAKGASKAAAAAPPPFNIPFILSFAATAIGIVSAMKQAVGATKSAAASAGASAGGGTSIETPQVTASAPSLPPEVTGVGGSGINQLASAIGEQQQQPVQAFVVSNAVTTSQSLERNIIDGASIG